MRLMLNSLALLALSALRVHPVAAQSWVVVPAVVGSAEDADLSASRARASLSAGISRDARVMDPKTARERFETRGSTAPVAATHGDIDQLARDAQQALYHVAMGLYTSAGADVARVMSRAERALESLNRETLAARQLLDSCLFIVRARMQERKLKAARQQALECRRLVPDIEPDASMHPPDVIGELAAAEAELESQRPASLRITSDPSGCPAFIQGRNLGSTPLELPRLSPGDYRIQAECVPGEYGRVHRVTLGPRRTVVHVDSHFDAAVQSGDGVSLRYGSAAASARLAPRHSIEVGRLVGARYVALITPEPAGDGAIRISKLEVERGKVLAQVVTRIDEENEILRLPDALSALREDRSIDFSGETPAALVPSLTAESSADSVGAETLDEARRTAEEASTASADHAGDHPGIAAWTLGGVGAAAHVTGWILFAYQLGLEGDYRKVRELDDPSEARRRMARIDSFELAPPLVAGAGALLGTAALPLLLPAGDDSEVPAWSLGVGIGGLALAGVGAGLLIRGSGCDDFDRLARCDDVVTTTHLGALLISAAVPLLGVPVVHWFRTQRDRGEPALSLDASHRHLALYWRGTL